MIYSVIVKVGLDVLLALSVFVVGCAVALALHLFGTMSLWIRFLAKRSPLEFFRQIRPLLVTAFSTSSSNACLADRAGQCQRRPETRAEHGRFRAAARLDHEHERHRAVTKAAWCCSSRRCSAWTCRSASRSMLMLLAVLSAVAVAGIPGGSLPLIAGLLATFGVPPEGIGIIIGVDRVLDMMRTTVNVGSDMVTAAVVDRQMQAVEARTATP